MTSEVRPQITEEQARKFTKDANPWMSCDDCFDHLDEFVDLGVSEISEWGPAMLAHLDACEACRDEVESLRSLLGSDGEGA